MRDYKILKLFIVVCVSPIALFAYLDPGTGSLLLSSVVALIASGVFFFKGMFYRIIRITSGGGIKIKKGKIDNNQLVFYSEGKQYHNVFKPILKYLDSISYPYTYLTSSIKDYNLHFNISSDSELSNIKYPNNPNAHFEYIGSIDSNKAISRLNTLKADVVMMTTPQLHVLQIKRSKSVKHYCHIIHALPHVDIYEIFALDYFDSVFTNSVIHTDFIRQVEQTRKLKSKQITITGCSYLDVLNDKLNDYRKLTQDKKISFFKKDSDKHVVLIAPSWGRESLLAKYGMTLLQPLLDSKFNVIIRPHPQSYVSQKELIDDLTNKTKDYANAKWDTNIDNIYAMDEADIMIGDFSGVIFDFVCLFEKPVITPEFNFNIIGYDLEDIYTTPWVKDALKQIGQNISLNELDNITNIIESMLINTDNLKEIKQNISSMKKLLWEHQGLGGEVSAKEILKVQKEILLKELDDKMDIYQQINTINNFIHANENAS